MDAFALQRSAFGISSSVPEVASAGEDHRDAVIVCGGDHLSVTNGAARLHDGRGPGGDNRIESVAERKKGIRSGNRAGSVIREPPSSPPP